MSETKLTSAPSAARLAAVFAAPPAQCVVLASRTTGTGASLQSRMASPSSQVSSIASPMTRTRSPGNPRTTSTADAVVPWAAISAPPRTEYHSRGTNWRRHGAQWQQVFGNGDVAAGHRQSNEPPCAAIDQGEPGHCSVPRSTRTV